MTGRDRHAGKARRPLVAADGEDIAAEAGGVEDDGRDRGEDDEDDGRDRHDIVEEPLAEDGEDRRRQPRPVAIGDVDVLIARDDQRQPARRLQAGERHDEGLEPEAGRDRALHGAERRCP